MTSFQQMCSFHLEDLKGFLGSGRSQGRRLEYDLFCITEDQVGEKVQRPGSSLVCSRAWWMHREVTSPMHTDGTWQPPYLTPTPKLLLSTLRLAHPPLCVTDFQSFRMTRGGFVSHSAETSHFGLVDSSHGGWYTRKRKSLTEPDSTLQKQTLLSQSHFPQTSQNRSKNGLCLHFENPVCADLLATHPDESKACTQIGCFYKNNS